MAFHDLEVDTGTTVLLTVLTADTADVLPLRHQQGTEVDRRRPLRTGKEAPLHLLILRALEVVLLVDHP